MAPGLTRIRVRIDRDGEPALSVEDLRASESADLIRLAEADRARSSSMYTVGDDDGWLVPSEVDGASGLHFSIEGGYLILLEELKGRPVDAVPMSKLQGYMTRAVTEPIRHRVMPPTRPVPKDPILFAENYDPMAGATPQLLGDQEAAIGQALSKEPAHVPVSRGFALDRYGGSEMVRYLFGDWRCMIASHDFSKSVRAKLQRGLELHDAVEKTATEISERVVSQIRDTSVEEYMKHNSRATQIGIRDKRATAMAAWPDDRIDRPADMPNSPFCYARTGYSGLTHQRVVPAEQPMIAIEVNQKRPADFDLGEYYIPSHVPPTKVTRFFLGFSNWHDAHAFLRPPEREEQWYRVDIHGRDDDGRPTGFTITPIRSRVAGGMERWEDAGEAWVTGSASDAFLKRNPLLAGTINEIRRQLA